MKRPWIRYTVITLSAGLVLSLAAVYLVAVGTWNDVGRVTIQRPPSGTSTGGLGAPDGSAAAPQVPASDDGLDVFLLVGSDSRSNLEDTSAFGEFEGQRADVVMVLARARSTGTVGLLSLPRDLWVESPCSGGEIRLNAAIEGCDSLSGPTLLTLTVERLIGLSVDHVAIVDIAGFLEVVDIVGGYEVCVDRPVRDDRAGLDLPAGCTMADGLQTLAWLRSRHTQELTESGWRSLPGVNDLMRNERQREFLIEMMMRLGDFGSPQEVSAMASALAPWITVDADLSLLNAVGLAWTLRGLQSGSITELTVPVRDEITASGAQVLVPAVDVQALVAEFLAPELASGDAALVG